MNRFNATKNLLLLVPLFVGALAFPAISRAANKNILVYFCDCDAWGTDCGTNFVAALQADPTNTVTAYNVSDGCTPGGPYTGAYYCPGANATSPGPNGEVWNNYDQVWDVRYVNQNSVCPPTGTNIFPDYFGPCWQTTAQDYLTNYCGSLFMLAENSGFESRWYGELQLIVTLGGVGAAFTLCPGPDGQGFGSLAGNLPVINLPGAASVGFADEGGIPNTLLNGTSFVNVAGSNYTDGVARSASAGWNGSAGNFTNESGCNLGKASIFFDMDNWAGGYPSGGVQPTYAQALANWFGVRACTCNTNTPTPTPAATNTFTVTPSPTSTATPSPTNTPVNSFTFTNTPTVTSTLTPAPSVSFQKLASSSTAQPGNDLTYTFDLTVTGNTATNVQVEDVLPNGLVFQSSGSVPAGGTSNFTPPNTVTVDWTSLAPGSYSMTVQVAVNGNVASGSITNIADLTFTGQPAAQSASAIVSISAPLNVWPNPFNPTYAWDHELRASVVPAGGQMFIFSVSGELVWNSQPLQTAGEIDWYGKNNKDILVSTGTYYYVIQQNGKNLLVGKLLVLMD
jgi:uncharacterized repeat protein (TIGR01451 family)